MKIYTVVYTATYSAEHWERCKDRLSLVPICFDYESPRWTVEVRAASIQEAVAKLTSYRDAVQDPPFAPDVLKVVSVTAHQGAYID
jgi:hypothetical protein